jgi:hypothetical protein
MAKCAICQSQYQVPIVTNWRRQFLTNADINTQAHWHQFAIYGKLLTNTDTNAQEQWYHFIYNLYYFSLYRHQCTCALKNTMYLGFLPIDISLLFLVSGKVLILVSLVSGANSDLMPILAPNIGNWRPLCPVVAANCKVPLYQSQYQAIRSVGDWWALFLVVSIYNWKETAKCHCTSISIGCNYWPNVPSKIFANAIPYALVIDVLFAQWYQFIIGRKLQSAIVSVSVLGATSDQMFQAYIFYTKGTGWKSYQCIKRTIWKSIILCFSCKIKDKLRLNVCRDIV